MPILILETWPRFSLPRGPALCPTLQICHLLVAVHWGSGLLTAPPCPHLLFLPYPQPWRFSGPITFQKGPGVKASWQLSGVGESKLMSSLRLLLSPALEKGAEE